MTSANPFAGEAPTLCVGESGVTRSGKLQLQIPQFPHEDVVGGVTDGWGIQNVVAVVVLGQLGPQGLSASEGFR